MLLLNFALFAVWVLRKCSCDAFHNTHGMALFQQIIRKSTIGSCRCLDSGVIGYHVHPTCRVQGVPGPNVFRETAIATWHSQGPLLMKRDYGALVAAVNMSRSQASRNPGSKDNGPFGLFLLRPISGY